MADFTRSPQEGKTADYGGRKSRRGPPHAGVLRLSSPRFGFGYLWFGVPGSIRDPRSGQAPDGAADCPSTWMRKQHEVGS